MDITPNELNQYLDRKYGGSLADQYAKEDKIEKLANDELEDEDQFCLVIQEYVDFEVLQALLYAIYHADNVGNKEGVEIMVKSLCRSIYDAAVKWEMTA